MQRATPNRESTRKAPNPFRTRLETGRPIRETAGDGKHLQAFRTDASPAMAAPMNSPSPFMASVHVAIGGGIGALLRHQLGRGLTHWLGAKSVTAFPWATLTVNLLGSFAMGLLAGWLARHGPAGEPYRLLLGVGLLGGFTTFSAFSLELMLLIERGQGSLAFFYAAVSVLAGLTALYIGLILMRVAG